MPLVLRQWPGPSLSECSTLVTQLCPLPVGPKLVLAWVRCVPSLYQQGQVTTGNCWVLCCPRSKFSHKRIEPPYKTTLPPQNLALRPWWFPQPLQRIKGLDITFLCTPECTCSVNPPSMTTATEKRVAGCGRKRCLDLVGTEKRKAPLPPKCP